MKEREREREERRREWKGSRTRQDIFLSHFERSAELLTDRFDFFIDTVLGRREDRE